MHRPWWVGRCSLLQTHSAGKALLTAAYFPETNRTNADESLGQFGTMDLAQPWWRGVGADVLMAEPAQEPSDAYSAYDGMDGRIHMAPTGRRGALLAGVSSWKEHAVKRMIPTQRCSVRTVLLFHSVHSNSKYTPPMHPAYAIPHPSQWQK